jgi:ankyrin repeat protein
MILICWQCNFLASAGSAAHVTIGSNAAIVPGRVARAWRDVLVVMGETMTDGPRKRISAADVVSDIRSGMGDLDLMRKYEVTEKQLVALLTKLIEKGHMSRDELNRHFSRESVEQQGSSARAPGTEGAAKGIEDTGHATLPESTKLEPPGPIRRYSHVLIGVLCLIVPAFIVAIMLASRQDRWFPSAGHRPGPVEQVVEPKTHGSGEGLNRVRSAPPERKAKPQQFNQETPLLQAAREGDQARVRQLLAQGADVNEKAAKQWTALLIASDHGRWPVVSVLLEHGADIEAKTNSGWTPLLCAANRGHRDVVEILLRNNAEINTATSGGTTALKVAARNGHMETVKLLLERGADVNFVGKAGEMPPLYKAMQGKRADIVKLLLQRDARFSLTDRDVTDYVIQAAKNGDLDTLRTLLPKGMPADSPESLGSAAVYAAVSENRFETAKWLLENGADLKRPDPKSITPLRYAIRLGNREMVSLLIKHGADPNHMPEKTTSGGDDTPLIEAIEKGDPRMVTTLLEAGADIDAKGSFGRTPLENACGKNAVAIMELLIRKGADVNARVKEQNGTVLMSAAANNRVDAAKLLLARGANVNLKDDRGITAMGYAKIWKRQAIVELLEAHGAKE